MAELNNEVHDTLQADWADFTQRVSGYNQYLDGPDPDTVLRRGLMEEAREMWVARGGEQQSLDYLKGEVGDVLYYIVHTAQHNGITELQTAAAVVLVYEVTDEGTQQVEDTLDVALIHILRVNDILMPRNDSLWMAKDGSFQRSEDLRGALESAITALKQFTDEKGFSLNESMTITADKLDTRARKPHVIEEQEGKKMLVSGRERAVSSLTKGALRVALQTELALLSKEG